MQSNMRQSEGFTMQLTCEHAAIHIVNDVATCTDCGQTLGCIDRQDEEGAAVLVECLTCVSDEDPLTSYRPSPGHAPERVEISAVEAPAF